MSQPIIPYALEEGYCKNFFIEVSNNNHSLNSLKDNMTETKRLPTLGEYRVGLTFNPSNNEYVEIFKRETAKLIDLANECSQATDNPEAKRLWALAMTHFEDAAMWSVKAATKPPFEILK